MTWTPLPHDLCSVVDSVTLWIRTARDAGYAADWLPSHVDAAKSALFERIRSGRPPLEEPPPRGLACPWYALVEDRGPHYVGAEPFMPPVFGDGISPFVPEGHVSILQNLYEVVERLEDGSCIVADAHHEPRTSYRFRLSYDPDWKGPGCGGDGAWFLQSAAFLQPAGELPAA